MSATTQHTTGVERDRLTWLIYGLFGVLGFFIYGFSPALTLLRDDQNTSSLIAGLHGTFYAAGAVLIGFCGHIIVARYERASSVWLGLSILCIGTIGVCAPGELSTPAVTLPAAFTASVGYSLLINTASAALSDRHGARSASAMNEANAAAAGTGLLAPLMLSLMLSMGAGWRFGLLLTVALAATVWAVLRVPIPSSRNHPAVIPAQRAGDAAGMGAAFWWALGAMALACSTEFCLTIWASDVLRDRTDASAGVAALSVTAVVTGILIGRLVAARFARNVGVAHLLLMFLTVIAAGFVVFWLSPMVWLSFLGLLICGLGVGPMFPLTFSALIDVSGGRPDLAAARSSLAIGVAVGVGPLLIGALTDTIGAHRALLTVPVLVVLAMLAVGRASSLAQREQPREMAQATA